MKYLIYIILLNIGLITASAQTAKLTIAGNQTITILAVTNLTVTGLKMFSTTAQTITTLTTAITPTSGLIKSAAM